MSIRRTRLHSKVPGGYFTFEELKTKGKLQGHGYGDHIVLHDELGNVWKGSAERGDDNTVRYNFRDEKGNKISGVADGLGITLRDSFGKVWRGFVD